MIFGITTIALNLVATTSTESKIEQYTENDNSHTTHKQKWEGSCTLTVKSSIGIDRKNGGGGGGCTPQFFWFGSLYLNNGKFLLESD
jgi:hypothetical protein